MEDIAQMKVLHIISAPAAGGAEIYVKDLAKALARQGVDIHIGFLNHASDVGRNPDFEKSFLSELDRAGIGYFFIGHASRKNPWLGAWRVWRFVKSNGIDIYHSHLGHGVYFSCLLKTPRIYTHHSNKARFNKLNYYLFNRIVTAYIGISAHCASNLRTFTGRSVTTIRNGADPEKIIKRTAQPRITPARLVFLSIGRIQPQKNYGLLVEAVSRLPSDLKNRISFRIAGEGPRQDVHQLRTLIRSKGLEQQIQLLGNRSDIPALLASADVFVMSSAWEGLPIALIESALAGLPCVVTDVGGCSEVVRTCRNGILVEPDDPQALADAITRIARHPELRREYSDNAARHSGVFNIETACTEHLNLYRSLMAPEPVHDLAS